MRTSLVFALVIAAAIGCRRDQPTLHQARVQNTPTEQAAQAEELDMENPNNRTLPDSTEPDPDQQDPDQQDPNDVTDPSAPPTTSPDPDTRDPIDDLPPNTGPDVP
jgi:hypothetical protein